MSVISINPQEVNLWDDNSRMELAEGLVEQLAFFLPDGVSLDPSEIDDAILGYIQIFVPKLVKQQ